MPAGAQKAGGQKGQAMGFALVRVSVGLYLVALGTGKIAWIMDSAPLAQRLAEWQSDATPAGRWYLERIIPGVPIFARLVPLAEILGGLALAAGFWTRLAAGLFFVMVLNFHLASGALFELAFLRNPNGIPLLGALVGLAIGGGRLPFSIRR
jgi:uncharacterized membrane protein YphA (DoxX/SURF4 family)